MRPTSALKGPLCFIELSISCISVWNIFTYKKKKKKKQSGEMAWCLLCRQESLTLDSQYPGGMSSMEGCVSDPRDTREGCRRSRDGGRALASQSSQNRTPGSGPISKNKVTRNRRHQCQPQTLTRACTGKCTSACKGTHTHLYLTC